MATYTTYTTLFGEQLGATDEQIIITVEYGKDFTGDGLDDIRLTFSLAPESNSGSEDIIGVAFDIQDDAVDGLQITDVQTSTEYGTLSDYDPTWLIGADAVADGGTLDPGFSTSGGGSDEPYDVGLMVSEPGAGEGIVQSFSFVLTSPDGDLDAEALLENTDWWVRIQSTDGGAGSAKTGGAIVDLPTPDGADDPDPEDLGDGTANTPGYWKNHGGIFSQETGHDLSDSFEFVFGVDVVGGRKFSADPTLAEALGARGGGEAALLRAATAAWANAVSDDVNYVMDEDALAAAAAQTHGLDPESPDYATDLAGIMVSLTDTLGLVDANGDGRLTGAEIIGAVQDIYAAAGAATDHFDWSDVGTLASALDTMNNMPHVDTADFFA